MARNLLDDYMNQPKRQGNKNLLDEYIKMSTPKLDTTAYTNMLNTLLNSSAVTGNGYQTPVVMDSAAITAKKAQWIAEKYGIGDSSYRQYLDSVASGVQDKQKFMSQFTSQRDYNERYAYPQTVKGKTDAEIEAMIGTIPKTQNMLNRAAAFGKGTGSSGDDAYLTWLNDYFNNKTVTGIDRQIADNQSLLDANKAKQEGLLASAYVPENVGMTAADRKIREDYITQYPNQERQEMEWTEMATGLAGWEEQKQIIEEMIKELQESGSFDQAKMDELQDSWLNAERHIHNLEEQMDAHTDPDEAKRLAGQETHTDVGATPEQERLDARYYQYLDELDKDNKLKYETGPEQWAYDRDMQLSGLTSEALDLEYEEVLLKVKREEVAAGSKYNELSKAPDFKALSTYDSSIEDDLYNYLNTKGTSQETGKKLMLGMENYGYDADEIRGSVYSDYGYTFLLPEEVQAYNYIYKKEGREKAQEFLDSFQNIRNLRARSKESEEWKKYAEETGAWSSVVSWGTKLASGMMYPVQLADAVFNPDHSQFSSLYSANYATQAIRGVRGEVWDKKAKEWFGGKDDEYPKFMGENLGSVAYNLFMGLGDMTLAHGAGKMAATLGNINFAKGVTEFVVGSQVGSDVLLQNLHNGVPKDRAIAMAVAASVVESLTERFSIDAIWKDPDNAAKFIAKNIATEASEESVSTFANTIVDLIVNANHAELSKAIAEDGYEKAMNAYLQSVGLDAIMGGLTGAIMSGAKVAGSNVLDGVQTVAGDIKTGKQINANQTYKQLHDIAVAMPEGSKARKIAQGKEKLNNRKAGQLYNALMEELDAKSQAGVRKSMVTDIKGRLQELGAQGDTSQVAEAIQKAWMGEKLSAREADLIAQNKLAMQVQHELLDLEEGWAGKAQETASKQRRETLTQMLDVERLASKGYKPAQDDAAAKAISKNASTTYANADQEQGLNTKAYTKEGTTVEIKRIEDQDGKAVYLVEKDGQDVTYAINDLELDSINTENLVQPLKRGKMSVQAANTMMQFYATSGLSAPLYAKGFMVAYNAGVQRIGMAYVNANSYSKALSPEVRKAAFDAGMADTKDEAPKVTKRKGRVTVDKSIDKANLTDGQKASIRAMEKIAKALHIDIEFFASKADATGSYAAYENGSFRDGVMRLDINAGRDKSTDVTEFAILRTASHELTHYIAEASPQMYRELQAFVVDHLLEKGESLQTLMDRKKARESRTMSDEAALEEVIADACEMMLKDSTAIETLARENATLFEKIADWLSEFFDKIREAFAGVEAVHSEARALMEADADGVMHYIDGLQALWDKALVDAAHNVSAAIQTTEAIQDENGNTMYSLRSMQEDYDTYKQWLIEAGVSYGEISTLFDTIDAVMARVEEKRHILDFGADIGREDRSFLPVKPNADPLYKVSLDFSSLCRKRLLQQAVQERLESKYKTVLTKAERVAIRNALVELRKQGKQIEVACALCYVESARLKSPKQIERFMNNKRAMLVDYLSKASDSYKQEIQRAVDQKTTELGYAVGTPMSQMSKADKSKVQAVKKGMYPKYKPTAAEEAMIQTAESLPEEMYKTADGLWDLKENYPEIFEAYTTFVRNATKSKGIEKDTPFYAGDTASISDGLIEAMNRENGLRSQSWSDFQVLHMLDYMAAVIELSTRGAKMQSYTKVPEFVHLMGRTGAMINLSLIPNDYDGSLTFDDIEGMNMDVAQKLRDTYHDTAGTISIGISDAHIRALLASGLIDYVIPYHKSSLDKKSRQAMGLKNWDDYEASQGEKQKDYPETDKKGANYHKAPLFSEWYNHADAVEIANREQKNAPDGDVTYGARMAMIEMADRYVEMCHERGLTEKFPQFAAEENYWKLLTDRKMIDHVTGELIEQRAIQPKFDKQALLDILDGEVKRFEAQNKDFEDAVGEILNAWERGDIRKAAKSKKVQDEVSAFNDTVLVRNIVESAGEDVKFSRRGGGLLNSEEAKRLESNWNDYKYRGYQFTKRPNGGIMVSMGNILVYTHPTGDPEYVLEVPYAESPEFVWDVADTHEQMIELERKGESHETSVRVLESLYGKNGAYFRSRGKGRTSASDSGRGRAGQAASGVGKGVYGKVSAEGEVQGEVQGGVTNRRSIFFPSRFNRLFDQYLAKTQSGKYDPANFNPGEFTTMRIGDDVLLLKLRNEKEFGLSAHYGANLGSRLTNERFEGKRFKTRAEAIAWLNGLKDENGNRLLYKSDWDPTKKTMFNMREPVEQTKNMIAMHNIDSDAMVQFIKNGRLYWPSVAVVNDEAKFDSFGNYSLLFAPWQFGEDWDDPESAPITERFRMYGSDAYTPSLPQEVATALQRGEDTFRGMYGKTYTDPYSIDDYMDTLYGSRYNHGFPGSVRVNAAKRYSSIEAMKKDRDRLMRDGAIYDTMTIGKDLERLRSDLIYRILKNGGTNVIDYNAYAKFENDLLLNLLDTVEDGKYLEEYGQQLDVIIDYAKERGIKLNRQLAKELLYLFEDVANDVVGYFEIKFGRNVNGSLDSGYPQAIVAPDNLPNEIRTYAEEVGIPVYTYKAGDSVSRRNVVNEAATTEGIKFQHRDADTISSREALANALETAAKNDTERGLLSDYKKIIQSLNEDQEKLAEHQKIIRELSFKKGGLSQQEKDELAMAKNRAEIVRNRLNRNDKKLLNLEATEALKAVVARERVVAERKIREEKDKQLAAYRERTRDTLTRSALRDRIKHDVKALNRLLLNETDVKHVPEELKGAVAQFLTVFTEDSSVFDQKKLDDLRYAYGKISDRNAANEDLPDISAQYDWDIANMMDDLREILPGKRLSELTQEETRKIRDIVQHFKFIVKESSRLFFFDKSRDIASAGQRFIEDTDQQKKYNGPDGAVANMLRGGMITPSYFFKKLGGVAKELFDDLKQGESTYGLRVAQARKFFDDVAEKYHYDAWRNVKDDVLTLNTQQGHEVVLTREQALGLYATWNRENSDNGQSAKHLSEGGFVYEEAMKKDKKTGKIEVDTSKPHKMTDADMLKVASWLTDEQRAYADAMVEYMSKDMAKLGNEVSMKLFGIEKYGEEKYYPYQTSKNYRYTALGAGDMTNDQRLKHSSFTHRVTQFANNPIIVADFTTVWANHVNHMLLYSSMCVPLENFNRVYNYKYTDEDGNHSVKQSLINAYGSAAQKYIEQLMHDLNGGVAVQSDGVMDQLISKFKKNAVYASASVVVQQPSAMVRAMALVNPKYFASGVMKDGSWDELTRYSGVAVIKEMGGFDTSTGFGAQDWITGERRKTKLETFSKKADDIASLLPERADRLAWVAIWKAVKAEVADNTGLEGEELLQEAAKRFDEVIGYTQVYDSTLSKSQMMRNKHLNAVTAFMAEPTVTYNLLVDAFFNRGKADSVNPARAVAAFTATAIVNALLKSLVTAARDDEEKNYLEKYAGEFVENVTSDLNPLNLIPYARDIVSIMQGYDVERADMSLISDLYKGVRKGIESGKEGDWYTMAKEFAGPISGLVGLPVKNVWRDIEAVFNTIHSIGTPMTPGGMKYSILEALPFYGSTPTDYYGRRLDAMLEGDSSELESLTIHLETGLGKSEKTIKTQTKTQLGKRYKAGKIGDAEATDILMDYFEMDADEAYWQLKEWREKEAHKDEDDYSFSRTDDLREALLSGKTAQIEAAKTELAGVGGYTDKEVVSKAKNAIKSLYVDGQITIDKAMKLLQEQAGEMTKDELYWTEQEWAYEKANPDGEWNKFMVAHAAIESGKGAKQAAKELLTHGVEKGDAARAIATRWKDTYVSMYKTDRKAALDLHSRILDMYVALGYNRSYQIKYIKDHWFE